MIVLDLSILNQKGTPMFNSDLFANRPAAGIVGRIFISTDTKEFFRDTGTSWELIGGPGSGTITGSGAATQVAFWNGASTITGSNNLFWDSTNNYLGISTNTPTTALDVHHSTNSGAIFNQTTGTNNNTINFQTSGSGRWRIGNFYTAGADDFGIFDVVGSLQQFTISNTTGQTFIGAKTTASGRLVVNSATADAHLQVVGANSPSIRIDNAGSGGTQRFVFGLATATNNFIQGAAAGQFCISTQSSGAMLFGMWQTTNASEVMRISTANNLIVGSSTDNGNRFQVTGNSNIIGNFGVGTTSPIYKLDVQGTSGTVAIRAASNTAGDILYYATGSVTGSTDAFRSAINATGNVNTILANNNAGTGGSTLDIQVLSTSTGDPYLTFTTSGANNWCIGIDNSDSDKLKIGPVSNPSSGADSMVLHTSGNTSLGSVVDNGNRLQVTGASTFSGSITAGGSVITTSSEMEIKGVVNAIKTFYINRYGVASGSQHRLRAENGYFEIASANSEPISFANNNLIRMTIKSTGIINMSNVPASSVGLVSGDIYQTAGVLNIVP